MHRFSPFLTRSSQDELYKTPDSMGREKKSRKKKDSAGSGSGCWAKESPRPPPNDRAYCTKAPIDIKKALCGRSITVLLGPTKSMRAIHEQLLTAESKFFLKAFENPMSESRKGTIELPETQPEDFDVFAEWLYNRAVNGGQERHGLPPVEDAKSLFLHLRLYVFANTYLVDALEKLTLVSVFRYLGTTCAARYMYKDCDILTPAHFDYVFMNTMPNSPIRRVICDYFSQYRWIKAKLEMSPARKKKWNDLIESNAEVAQALFRSSIECLNDDGPTAKAWSTIFICFTSGASELPLDYYLVKDFTGNAFTTEKALTKKGELKTFNHRMTFYHSSWPPDPSPPFNFFMETDELA